MNKKVTISVIILVLVILMALVILTGGARTDVYLKEQDWNL